MREVGFGPVQCGLQSLDCDRVGARQDERAGAGPGVHRGIELAGHLTDGHHRFSVEMAAPLGERLVLQLNHGGARPFEALDRAHHVQGVSKARVGVDDHRHRHALGDARERLLHLAVRG
jgi:hypothetical protein